MTDKDIIEKLSILGYTHLWLDYGIITVEYLNKQVDIFNSGDDDNTEHYRYAAFKDYLNSKLILSDIEFDNYLQLALNDNDRSMGGSATADLFKKVNLTENQFNRLCNLITRFGQWTEKLVELEKSRRIKY